MVYIDAQQGSSRRTGYQHRKNKLTRSEFDRLVRPVITRYKNTYEDVSGLADYQAASFPSTSNVKTPDQFNKHIGSLISKALAIEYGDFKDFMENQLMFDSSFYWTSYERKDMFTKNSNLDKKLFDIIFKDILTVTGDGDSPDSVIKTSTSDAQVKAEVQRLINADIAAGGYFARLNTALEAAQNAQIEQAVQEAEQEINNINQQQLKGEIEIHISDQALLDKFNEYFSTLTDSEDKLRFRKLSSRDKVQELFDNNAIDKLQRDQFINKLQSGPPIGSSIPLVTKSFPIVGQSQPTPTDMEDPEFYERYSENRLYKNILNDLMEVAAKKQKSSIF